MKNDNNIQKYQAFIKAVETGSFTKAAEALNYTQANISMMIRDLEEEWEIKILERSRSGIKLTSDGEKVLPFAQSLCNEYQKLKERIDEIRDIEVGTIRIGTISSIATYILPEKIKVFKEKYPNIEYEILLGDHEEIESWIESGRIDFGILKLPTKADLESELLLKDELVLIYGEDIDFKENEKIDIKTIEDYRFILWDKSHGSEILDIIKRYDIKPNTEFVTWDDYAIMSMVEQGLGISILPKLILSKVSFNIKIREFKQDCFRELGLVYKDLERLPKAAVKFLELIRE